MTTTTQLQDHVGLRAPLLFAAVILLASACSIRWPVPRWGGCCSRQRPPAARSNATATSSAPRWCATVRPCALLPAAPSAANYDPRRRPAATWPAASGPAQAHRRADPRHRRARRYRAGSGSRRTGHPIGGGLDPHLSPRAAQVQVARVAKVRGIDIAIVEDLLARHIEAPQFGVLGQPRVNVLRLNLALDALARGSGRHARIDCTHG